MRLLRVDNKGNKVEEIKTFDPLKSKYAAIQTAVEHDREGGKYLLDEGTGEYYEFDVKDGQPHFLPGNEGLHTGMPERHLARIQHDKTSLKATKEKYGDFFLDSPGAAPEENPFVTPPPPTPEQIAAAEAEAAAAAAAAEAAENTTEDIAPVSTEAGEEVVDEEVVDEETVEGDTAEETEEVAEESTDAIDEAVATEATGAEETEEVSSEEEAESDEDATEEAPPSDLEGGEVAE